MSRRPDSLRFACAGLIGFLLVGCQRPVPSLRIDSHRTDGTTERFATTFDPGAYHTDGRGNLDVVMQATAPSSREQGAMLRQVFWLHVFWKPVPGTTFVERTQTNTRMTYALIDVDQAICYEGAGFATLQFDGAGGTLRGTIESGTLVPTRVVGDAPDLLGACLVSGSFVAERGDSRVVATLTEIRQTLGPPPHRAVEETPANVR